MVSLLAVHHVQRGEMYNEMTVGGKSIWSQLLNITESFLEREGIYNTDTRWHTNPRCQQYHCDSHACVQPTVCVGP